MNDKENGHNPYFNRWFSAIGKTMTDYISFKECHNPYFNRWFSAIKNNSKSKFYK